MGRLLEFATQPVPAWRVAVVALVVAAASVTAGVGVGRLNALESVEEHLAVVELRRERVIERWHKAKDRVAYVERTTSPDGTVFEKRSERETERAELARDADLRADAHVESSKVTTSRPDWRVTLQLGATWKEPAVRLGDTPLVIGGSVERRVIGPFSLGAWGSTSGAAGVSVSGEF